jgi:signal transduction histidine kinase
VSERSRIRILHVEDDPRDRELVAATLKAEDVPCDIVTVDNREDFIAALSSPFDVILADDRLPTFDGLTALTIASERVRDTPFIFVSGTLGEEVAIDRMKAGATDFVLKQRLTRLPAAIARAIREAQTRAEHARAAAALYRLNAELEQRVLDRTEELARANAALEEQEAAVRRAMVEAERANSAKSVFLSRMSHDLRTPLNAVIGFSQLLAADSLLEGQQECVQQILKASRHLLELINEVLEISRIEAGHLSLSPEPVGVGEIVRHAAELVAPLAAQRGIAIDIDETQLNAGTVMADRQRLSQILLNLFSNAVKYNRQAGRVAVSVDKPAARRVRISISDTGSGISPEKLKLLFRPFERLGAESTGIEGTGLGLTLSRGLAEAMGGAIGVATEIDKGSTFWVELDATEEPAIPVSVQPTGALTNTVMAGPATVLYIEDNSSNVRLMTRLLANRPAVTLLHAPDGSAGLRAAREDRPDLIFLDLHLPDMSGEEVLRQLWSDRSLRDVPIVVLSADATAGHIRRVLASGATAYLTKPFDLRKLLDLVDQLLPRDVTAR